MAGISSGIGPNAANKEVVSTNLIGESRDARLYVRLRPEDRLLLRERAAARGLRGATYLSVLARSHLLNLPPLPKEELQVLKRAVSELAAIAGNLNQIAYAPNAGARMNGPSKDDCGFR